MLMESIANATGCKTQTDNISAGQACVSGDPTAIRAEKEGREGNGGGGEGGMLSNIPDTRSTRPGQVSMRVAQYFFRFGIANFLEPLGSPDSPMALELKLYRPI
jgi:hypothetical protein